MNVTDKNKEKEMILNYNLWRVMFRLSWPAVIAMVLYGLNTVFDAIFVGQFVGETALAGVSLSYPLSQITMGIGSLIGVGAGSALSIALGANDKETQKRLLGNANYLILLTSIVYIVLGIFFATPLVRVMGGEGEALILGSDYFRVTVYGAIFWIAGLAGNMIIRAEGKMKSAAIMMGLGLLVNIVANYILIVLMGLGVKGAAWGSNIGMLFYTLLSLGYFRRGKATFDAKPFSIKRDRKIIKSILSMGIPSFIMTIMSLIQAVVVLNAISKYGSTSDLAFYGATFRIFTFLLTPIFGLMRALQPVIGINYGGNKNQRVISSFKIFAVSSALLMLPFWLIIMLSPEFVLNLMLPGKTFIASDLTNIRIFMTLLPVLPIIFMAMTFFPAINKGKPASMIGISRQLVFYVPVMLIVPRLYGVSWVYIGSFIIDSIITLWTLILVKKEFKLLRQDGDNLAQSLDSSL
ncbi:MATE family efflux transporter [Clostridium botulinum]|uniref:MATE family efflux transporter n=1 Tax=Clostridium botulinum TaxID=1491 RepID=UPI002491A7BA|nr:MATE family efflux transporter [Clostridium botulinum]BDB01455.1 multidrug transporter MatE [Clostridium botulinum]